MPRIDPAELDAVIVRFVDDFQAIIRAQIEHTLRQAFSGAAPAARTPRSSERRRAVVQKPLKGRRVVRRGAAAAEAEAETRASANPPKPSRKKRAEQLSLF